uniref:Uncharacterized protein n=1 Tax=Anguilla anguilla TaxID=7936 RepID=A0A0E9PQJ1_ANGAN
MWQAACKMAGSPRASASGTSSSLRLRCHYLTGAGSTAVTSEA